MMIDDGKRVAAGGARLQWHMTPIADIDLIARNTGGKWGRVFASRMLKRRSGTKEDVAKSAVERLGA
jgi:hypothetical protein